MNRREFIGKSGLLASMVTSSPLSIAHQRNLLLRDEVQPDHWQREWMKLKFGMFIHFGINTFYDKEWSDGSLDPAGFDPGQVNTDQWCRVAIEAGMKYVVITTKHHDGFCLWPSKFSNYTVAQSPYKKDLLDQLAGSAAKYGLKLGWYFSLWDAHDPLFSSDWWGFMDKMKGQLHELLTQYGEITELWFDGFWKKQKTGWTKKNASLKGEATREQSDLAREKAFIEAWRQEGAYWWQMDALYRDAKRNQPGCMIMNNSTSAYPGVPLHPVDIRSGEKYTDATSDQKVWEWLGEPRYFPLQIETTMSVKGNKRFPSGNWFWHAWDHSVLTPDEVKSYLQIAQSLEANLLLNVGISDQGTLRPEDENTLMNL